jgi:nucleoside-diphosphate-sugar epimerase
MGHLLADDLDRVLLQTADLWESLRGRQLFLTGGTGFFGSWLLESFAWAHDRLELDARAVVLTRDPDGFRARRPHLARHPAIECRRGDVRTFPFGAERFSHVIHAATYAPDAMEPPTAPQLFSTIVDGTRRVLEFASHCGAEAFLFTSSGAVYGTQPPDLTHVAEEYAGAPDPLDAGSVYGEGKRAAELLCAAHGREHDLRVTIARCFAFVGPYLPLDANFAVGNFIRDALRGGPIRITGDGTPYRSYLYAADLATWLWTILFRGRALRAYNVGSASAITIGDLAQVVARTFVSPVSVEVARIPVPGAEAQRYVPAVSRAFTELGLQATVSLEDGIRRTVSWHQQQRAGVAI